MNIVRTSSALVLALSLGTAAMAQTPLEQGQPPARKELARPANNKVDCEKHKNDGWRWRFNKCRRTAGKVWKDLTAEDVAAKAKRDATKKN